jgi:hypothetical protein
MSDTSQHTPWENPYWKDKKAQSTTSTKQDNKPWENPYWKDKKSPSLTLSNQQYKSLDSSIGRDTKSVPSKSAKQDTPWKNPYWTDDRSRNSTPGVQQKQSQENMNRKNYQSQFSTPSEKNDKLWQNPYWKDNKTQSLNPLKPEDKSSQNFNGKENKNQSTTSSKREDQSWENPYWKENKTQVPVLPKKQDEAWKNPYWKDWKPQAVTTSQQPQNSPLKDPYLNGKELGNSIDSKEKDKFRSTFDTSNKDVNNVVLNDVWILDNLSPPDHAVPPIPSFYERIYPAHTPPSSPQPRKYIKEKNLSSTEKSIQSPQSNVTNWIDNYHENDHDIQPYTIDGQGIAHYRSMPSSVSVTTNKTVTFATSPRPTQDSGSFSSTNNIASLQQQQQQNPTISTLVTSNGITPFYKTNGVPSPPIANPASMQSLNFFTSLPSYDQSLPIVITLEELSDIQNALRLLNINSNAIPTIESIQYVSTKHGSDEIVPDSLFDTLFTDNQVHKLAQSSSSSYPKNYPVTSSSHFNSRQPPTFYSSNKSSNPANSINHFVPSPVFHI